MSENGLNLEEIRMQSRHKRYETLQGYIQMSEQHVKEAYMKAMSLDTKPEKLMTQVETTIETVKQSNSSNLQLQLAQKLARGEITQEVYLQAINSLRLKSNSNDFSYY